MERVDLCSWYFPLSLLEPILVFLSTVGFAATKVLVLYKNKNIFELLESCLHSGSKDLETVTRLEKNKIKLKKPGVIPAGG